MAIQKVLIAGAGTMGSSMAQIFARYGYDVTLYNHREAKLTQAKLNICENTKNMVNAGELPARTAEDLLNGIAYTADLECFRDFDLMVECIAENMDIKKAFYEQISELAPADAIIATNTSGLSINELSTAVKGPERFIGMHWFNPPHLIPLIEIIRGDATADAVAQAIYDISIAINKKPAVVNKDVPGFAANRLQLAVVREALAMVADGVISKESVDAVMKYGIGFRWACLGPLETLDFGGLDVFYHISEYLMKDLNASPDIPKLLADAYEKGDLGVKTGRGFYDYSDGVGAQKMKERDEKLMKLYEALYK